MQELPVHQLTPDEVEYTHNFPCKPRTHSSRMDSLPVFIFVAGIEGYDVVIELSCYCLV